jgi:hypothetical protein
MVYLEENTFPTNGTLQVAGNYCSAARLFQVLLLDPAFDGPWSDPVQIPDMKSSWSLSFSRFVAPTVRSVLRVESAPYFMQLGYFVYYPSSLMATPRSWRAYTYRTIHLRSALPLNNTAIVNPFSTSPLLDSIKITVLLWEPSRSIQNVSWCVLSSTARWVHSCSSS